MRRCTRLFAALAVMAFSLTVALAQEPTVMQRYDNALASLDQSVTLLPTDIPGSLDALETASTALRRLSQDTSSAVLTDAMEQVFERARTAVVNQSQADLQVQTAVLRGGFQRGLMEASLADTEGGAIPGLLHLAGSLQFPEAAVSAIESAPDAAAALAAYQSGLATRVSALVSDSALQLPASQGTAYVSLATAYGDFLSLQDSPRADAGLNEQFTGLISAVVAGDQAQMDAAAPELSAQLTSLAADLAEAGSRAAAPVVPAALPLVDEAQPVEAEPAAPEPVAEQPPVAEPEVIPEPAAAEPVAAEPVAAEPAAAEPEAAEPAAPETPEAAEAELPTIDVAAIRSQIEEEAEASQLAAIVVELGQAGIRGTQADSVAAGLLRSGHDSVAGALNALNSSAMTFSDLVASGNQAAASSQLAGISSLYRTSIAPVATRVAPVEAADLDQLISRLSGSPVLQNADALALTGQLQAVTHASSRLQAASVPENAQAQLQTQLTGLASGWPRLVLTVLTALLSIIPLVLLRMAFGGGNRNWGLIGTGLFLLFLPVILAAIAEILGLLAGVFGLEVLGTIGGWINPGTQLMQLVNLLLVLLAIILSSTGLYGICRQFGLFGGTENRGGLFGKRAAGKPENKTLVDWDEEF